MRKLAHLVALGAFIFLSHSAARAGETPYTGPGANIIGTGLYTCIGMISVSGQGPVKNYFYTTGTFPAPRAQAQRLETQWHDYLKSQKPGQLVSLASCYPTDPAKAAAKRQSWKDKYKSQATIIDTDWKYGAASAATTTVSQQPIANAGASADPNAHNYFCTFDDRSGFDARSGQGTIVRYMSGLFSSTNNFAKLGTDWSTYIRATYHQPSTTNGSCLLALGDGNGQGLYDNNKKTAQANKHMKLIDVDWKE